MPEASKNYSITELEMCRLAMNIASFSHLLKKVDFDAVVDHLAITHIMRSKEEPATTRINRLVGLLSPHSFNLYYIKGTDMVLSLVEAWYSLEQYIGLKEDKLSSTTVDFIRSEGNLETKHLYWFSKPKMC